MTPPKLIRNLIGEERTQYFKPLECLVIDSLYLPTSKHGFKYGLVLVDAATSKAIVFPSVNLKAATVKRHLRTLFGIHRPPRYLIADYGPEMRQDLDGFLAEFNVTMLGTKPYSKGSTAQAEITIRFVKQALRQLVLSHVSTWPEVLPHMLCGINSAPLANTTVSRDELLYTPLSVHNLAPVSSYFTPEALFDQHLEQHAKIVTNRQKSLKNKARMDTTEYVVGCVVAAENVPISHKKGESQELRPVPNGFYRVKEIHPTSLRLVNLINGEERTLPREYCRRSDLTELSQYKLKIKEHQFKLTVRNLFRENKYLSPDETKTWENLCSFKFPKLSEDIVDDNSESEPPYTTYDEEDNLEMGNQSNPEDQDNLLIDTTGDTVANKEIPKIVVDPDERRYRETRSGRSYCISVENSPPLIDAISPSRSILVSRPHTNDLVTIEDQYPLSPSDHQCRKLAEELSKEVGTDHQVQQVAFINVDLDSTKNKKLTWNKDITVRTYDIGSKCFIFQSELMQSLEKKVRCTQTYLMCYFIDVNLLDVSRRELFWETSRLPNPDNCLVLKH